MTFTIEFGWWLLPMAVTVGMFVVALRMNREADFGGGYFGEGASAMFSLINYLLVWVLPSLVAWLIWALLR